MRSTTDQKKNIRQNESAVRKPWAWPNEASVSMRFLPKLNRTFFVANPAMTYAILLVIFTFIIANGFNHYSRDQALHAIMGGRGGDDSAIRSKKNIKNDVQFRKGNTNYIEET